MDFLATLEHGLRGKGTAIGCSADDISALEHQAGIEFPADYREFLLRAGRGAEDLWRGSDYTLDELPEIQEAAKELLRDANLALPKGSFVFFMHQGYQFFFLNPDDVFFFLEGRKEIEKHHDSFADFFQATVHDL
jgi:hypothetical protein